MVNLKNSKAADRRESLLQEIQVALDAHQPELEAEESENHISVHGKFVLSGPAGPFDVFEIFIGVEDEFPLSEPIVLEPAGRIPHIPDRHVFPRHGICCLGVWEEWLVNSADHSFEAFLLGPLHSYFVSQSEFERTGRWPFGERSHGDEGIIEAYSDLLGVEKDREKVVSYLRLIRQCELKGHAICPCGCRQRLRNCEFPRLKRLREKIPPWIAQRGLKALAKR